MLRVHFTTDDLARTTLAPAADPLWETLLSAHTLQKETGSVVFGQWRSGARATLRGLGAEAAAIALLLRLMPPYGYSPDFFTPARGSTDMETGVQEVLHTPKRRLAYDLSRLAMTQRLPAEAGTIAAGEAEALRRLGSALHRYHATVLAPHWPRIAAAVAADRATRATEFATAGIGQVFRTLVPGARWEPPVWHVPFYRHDEMHLDGRGLTLVPTFFCMRAPVRLVQPELPLVLAYPIAHHLGWTSAKAGLATLLGRRRATLLTSLADAPASTGQLAERVGVSAPTASHHLSALREAGLVQTARRGQAVRHTLTARGHALLNEQS